MGDVFIDLLESTEIQRVPTKVRKFLHRDKPHGYAKTWEYFSYGYGSALTSWLRRHWRLGQTEIISPCRCSSWRATQSSCT